MKPKKYLVTYARFGSMEIMAGTKEEAEELFIKASPFISIEDEGQCEVQDVEKIK